MPVKTSGKPMALSCHTRAQGVTSYYAPAILILQSVLKMYAFR